MAGKSLIIEQLLITKLKSGDKESFSAVFSLYYKDLVLFAYSIVKDVTTAEEIAQETFIKLWSERETLEIKVSLKSFLLKSVQNKCIDIIRHRKIVDNYTEYYLLHLPPENNSTDSYILRSEMEESIARAVAKMPGKIKESFLLNREQGLKYREIADKLQVSVRTVEVRISKALELLRNDLMEFF
jgi:RNA polymerase sigma-70 factor (ECF subfamily)